MMKISKLNKNIFSKALIAFAILICLVISPLKTHAELIEEDSGDLTTNFSDKDTANLSRVIEKNRKIIKRYQALVRSAITLDALMDSENDENFKI